MAALWVAVATAILPFPFPAALAAHVNQPKSQLASQPDGAPASKPDDAASNIPVRSKVLQPDLLKPDLLKKTAPEPLTTPLADVTRWYSVEMFGGVAGVMRAATATNAQGVTSTSMMKFEIKRGAVSIKISMDGEFVETPEGRPIRMKSVQRLGSTPITQEWTFGPENVSFKSTQSGQVTTTTTALPEGEWLTPAAAERYIAQQHRRGAREIVTRTVDPQSGLAPIISTRTLVGPETLTIAGKSGEFTSYSSRVSTMPGIRATEYYDSQGVLVKGSTQMGGVEVIIRLSNETDATKGLEAGAHIAPDIFTSTFIKPDKIIVNPRGLSRGVYRLWVQDGELETPMQTGSQAFVRISPQSGTLTVSTDPAAFSPAPASDRTDPALLASTVMCTTSDGAIVDLAAKAVKKLSEAERADPAKVAAACREFVYRFISNKTLGVGYASATEIARTREGDCSEHGVLLCALLRVHKIPARVACGLIYADSFAGSQNIFGYHMWTQALLGEGPAAIWIDLDATLPVGLAYDATHICLAVSTLADGDANQSFVGMATNLGRLKIAVIEP